MTACCSIIAFPIQPRLCRHAATPVIMMTAHSTPDMIKRALDLGAIQVVNKPFEVHEMVDLVANALAAR